MAPAAKTAKPPAGKDIRSFFAGSSQPASQTPLQSSQPPRKKKTVKNGDKDVGEGKKSSESQRSTQLATGPSKKRPETVIISDSEEEPVTKHPVVKKRAAALISSEDEDEEPSPPKKKAASKPILKKQDIALISSDEDSKPPPPKAAPKRKQAVALLSSDDEGDTPPKKKPAVASSSKAPAVKPRISNGKAKKDQDYHMDSDSDSDTPLIPKRGASSTKPVAKKAATAKEKEKAPVEEKKKPNWAAIKAAKLAGPSAPGSKDVPDGAPNCLSGLSLVFTGELSAFSREEAVEIAKRYGARVVGQPSSKTDYVVLGDDAGPAKLAAIKKHQIKTLNEDEFLHLIATRAAPKFSEMDEKTKKKILKEEEEIQSAAKEMEKKERKASKDQTSKPVDLSSQLWTSRYAPTNLKEICGNKGQIEKLQQWLTDWPASVKANFKKPGKNAMNTFRAVLISGPPGIGKTTSAHICARMAGFTPIEVNASDSRSKKLVESGININNTSLDGFVTGSTATAPGMVVTDRTCLIMDEVDGMSAGDRGGVGALNALIKKSKIPIICIANDKSAQKLKPLLNTTFGMSFSRPTAAMVRSRLMTIIFKEKMQVPGNVLDQLIASSQSDIRQVLNMLSTWKLSSNTMSFDEGKDLARMNEKHSILSPFEITSKMLGPYLFSHSSRETLGDKMELYFQDHSFMPLFIQENYLRGTPSRLRNVEGPEKEMKMLQLMDKAASSISDGDLVDAMIHGPEQHWSLMPLHAVLSAVRPASYQYGQGVHFGGQGGMAFPQWLGQNSKQNKLSRQLGDVQIRMRLKVSGDKNEIRQSYIPALYPHLVLPLADVGATMVDQVIEQMDEYYLSKEEWDTIVELGVGDNKDDIVLKRISTAVKTSFTKKYNATEHPIAFHKAQDLGKAPKKLAAGPAPDIEDAFEMEDDVADSDDEKPSKNVDDIKDDKLIQAPKKKKVAKPKK
ncbi:purine nucleotide binding protein [Mycena floridula]|nr:purine nucleotide binding protein [Mycena floridula]